MKTASVRFHPLAGLITATVIAGGAFAPRPAIAQSQVQVNSSQVAQAWPTQDFCDTNLAAAINPILDQPRFANAQWGVVVESMASQTVLYSRNADQYFIPASNIKLLTTATALQALGRGTPNYSADFINRVRVINQDSNNVVADALFRALGGQQQIKNVLAPFGIDPAGYRQVDGSGLSRYNMVQPSTLVSVLRMMRSANGQDLFYNSLPVAGVNGTLRRRFLGTPAQGRVRAKTGTLQGVRALSGYLETLSGEPIVFSILVNQPGQSGDVMIDAIDQIVLQIMQLQGCQ